MRKNKLDNSIIYSTDPQTQQQISTPSQPEPPQGDGIVRLKKETKGRKGKGVVIIEGLALDVKDLKSLCQELKKKCGCGGTIKDFNIELQTNDREKIKELLTKKGYIVKISGG